MDTRRKSLKKHNSETFRGCTEDDFNIIETDLSKAPLIIQDESFNRTIEKIEISSGLKLLFMYKGLLYLILASFILSTAYAIVKYLKTVDTANVLLVNSIFMTIFSIPPVLFKNIFPLGPPHTRKIILIRSVVYPLVVYLRFSALHFLPIAEASVIIFSYPILVSVIARVVLKEPIGLLQIISAVLTVLGVALVSKLPLEIQQTKELNSKTLLDRTYGVFIAFASTIFGAMSIICTRWLKDTPFSVTLFNSGWVGIIVSLIIIVSERQLPVIPCGEPSLLIVFCSIIEIVGIALLYEGLKTEQAGVASVVRAASHITFLFCWQLLFFKEIPDIWSISGATIIIFCIILSGISKHFNNQN
ncbi:solute carrier family 35 member G1-like [Tachypleus tridentatus]|uniref:solute carrier family 35 member G1-like n=1 Tax=Tachypleus tridentatus TaxID=6853 RepID=UPI003FCEE9C8